MAAVDILKSPIREITAVVSAMDDVQELAALGRAERGGSRRSGVLNLLQGRIGELMTDPTVMAAQLAAQQPGQVPGHPNQTSEPILGMRGNSASSEHAIVGGNVTQDRAANVALYFMTEIGIAMPRYVAAGAARDCLLNGALDYCPDCGRTDCGLDANRAIIGDLNACPARQGIAFARCSIASCGRKVYDTGIIATGRELEEGEVDVSLLQAVTPAQRLKARLDIHMLAFHQDQARINGLQPMPTPSQVVAGAQPAAGAR